MKSALIIIALLISAVPARAEFPDGPSPIYSGQSAPADGVWLSSAEAVKITARYNECQEDRTRLKEALEAKPVDANSNSNAWIISGLLGVALGVIVGVVTVKH